MATGSKIQKGNQLKSFKEIGVPGEQSILPLVSTNPGADCLAVYGDGKSVSNMRRGFLPGSMALPSALLALFLCFVFFGLSGCSLSKPQLGPISVTDPSGGVQGQLISVIVNATVAVSVPVSEDGTNLGVDWSLTCLGSSVVTYTTNVCGTLNPVHVGSNINMLYTAPAYVPIGNTVTLTAAVTSDPSQQSSITLTILPQPITIAFLSASLPPAAMGASETGFPSTAQIAATVTNDPIAAGVNWTVTCGSSSCGSFSSALTASGSATAYTAPATIPSGGTVTVTATSVDDQTKTISAKIAIMPVAVSVSSQTITVPENAPTALIATTAYDASNAGIDWSAPVCGTPGACGSISPAHTASGVAATYTAPKSIPAGGSVTVMATSTFCNQNPSSCSGDPTADATVTVTINVPPPITVNVAATDSSMQLRGSTTLTATVANDYSNSGVTWQCSPGSCIPGASTSQPYTTTFTAPAVAPPNNTVTVQATSIADTTKTGTATIAIVPTISVAFTAKPSTVTAGVPATFSATVANDVAPGGLDWTATNCGASNCGTFNSGNPSAPNHSASGASITYTAPIQLPATTVTITATSTASETTSPVQSASTAVSVTPVTYVHFVPFAPSALPVANPSSPILVNLVAVAANDATNAGVDWSVCSAASTCGEFQVTPAIPATPTTQAIPPVYSATLHAASGQTVSYLPPTAVPSTGNVTVTVTSTATKSASAAAVIAMTNDMSGVTGVALNGKVQVGNQPVSGATVQLFAAGTTGYGSASSPLVISNGGTIVTTGTDGSFIIPAGYTCPAQTTELYLVALGGAPGGTTNNPQLGLMTAIGQCSNLNSSVSLILNEVTTVASTWALVPFTSTDYAHIGSGSSNYTNGFANAFATVNNLVDVTTGLAFSVTPAGYGTVPQAEINTLADVINTCAVTVGGAPGDGSPCSAFFEASNVSPLGMGIPGNSPTSILQAVLEVAQYPSNLYSAPSSGTPLYNLASAMANPPFTPVLTAAPNDWSIALSFTGGGLGGDGRASPESSSMAIDASGNVWIANTRISSVSELSNLGAPLSPFTTGKTLASAGGFTGAGLNYPQQIAIDPQGNAWTLNGDSSLSEFKYTGEAVTGSPFSGGGTMAGNGLAIDGNGFVWVTNIGSPGDVAEYAGYDAEVNGNPVANGTPVSPAGGYVNGINSPDGAIAVDGSGTVWVLNGGNYAAAELSSTNGALLQTDFGYLVNSTTGKLMIPLESVLSASAFGNSMAIDNAGDVFIPNPNTSGSAQIYELLAGGSTATDGGIGQSLSLPIAPVYAPIAIDGSGHLWLVTYPNTNNGEPSAVAELNASGTSLNLNQSAPGFVGPNISDGPAGIAVDNSGNVWVLIDTNSSTVTEFIGVATPVVTPLALGVQTKSLGKKP
jgi:hypothetical protein